MYKCAGVCEYLCVCACFCVPVCLYYFNNYYYDQIIHLDVFSREHLCTPICTSDTTTVHDNIKFIPNLSYSVCVCACAFNIARIIVVFSREHLCTQVYTSVTTVVIKFFSSLSCSPSLHTLLVCTNSNSLSLSLSLSLPLPPALASSPLSLFWRSQFHL